MASPPAQHPQPHPLQPLGKQVLEIQANIEAAQGKFQKTADMAQQMALMQENQRLQVRVCVLRGLGAYSVRICACVPPDVACLN